MTLQVYALEAGASGLSEVVEPVLAEQRIQPSIKGVTRIRRQIRGRDPNRRLPITLRLPIDMAQSITAAATFGQCDSIFLS